MEKHCTSAYGSEDSFNLNLRISYNGLGDAANYFPTVARIKQLVPKIIIPTLFIPILILL